ncbi:MAG TPA: inositol monophosphatase [Acidiferrobacterales bacterium]|nr:inositol monophosphatase [Acidiferrobacterales bacterium]
MLPDLKLLRQLMRTCAQEELLPRFADVGRHIKRDGSIVTEADHAMQDRVQRELASHWPEYDFLGEESPRQEKHEALAASRGKGLWILDPLDGTSNFAAGVPFFSVSLALLVDGRPEIGLVYDPIRDECFVAQRGSGSWLNGLSLGTQVPVHLPLARTIAVVDFKRLDRELAAKLGAEPPYGSQRNFGSSALDWCWLADGRFHVYLHGGQKLWDYAAGILILTEAGGQAVTLAGEEVFTGRLETRSVVATRDPELFQAWKAWVADNC